MRLRALLVIPAVLALTACGSGDSGPSPEEQKRTEMCEGFAGLTPGVIEVAQAQAVLADPSSTQAEKSTAMKVTLDQVSTSEKRTEPYDCNDPADAKLFEWYNSEYDE
ncbi:hypothetical protein ACYAFX_28640 (plasmid) [Rhodococcus aetherivorans]